MLKDLRTIQYTVQFLLLQNGQSILLIYVLYMNYSHVCCLYIKPCQNISGLQRGQKRTFVRKEIHHTVFNKLNIYFKYKTYDINKNKTENLDSN